MTGIGDPAGLDDLLDEETWAAPERLTTDDCFDHLGGDWRRPSTWQEEDCA